MRRPLLFLVPAVAALLAACTPTPAVPSAAASTLPGVLRGRLEGWTNATGARLQGPFVLPSFSAPVGVGGMVDADLPAPASDMLFLFRPESCTGDLALSDPNLRVTFVPSYGVLAGMSYLGVVRERFEITHGIGDGSTIVARVYADRPATARGRMNCGGDLLDVDYAFEAGWNSLKVRYDDVLPDGRAGAMTLSSVPNDARRVFVFTKVPPSFGARVTGTFEVASGGTVDVPVRIDASDDFAGDIAVALEAGPPGLSLDTTVLRPSTRGGEGSPLSALAVSTRNVTLRAAADMPSVTSTVVLRFSSGDLRGFSHFTLTVRRPGSASVRGPGGSASGGRLFDGAARPNVGP